MAACCSRCSGSQQGLLVFWEWFQPGVVSGTARALAGCRGYLCRRRSALSDPAPLGCRLRTGGHVLSVRRGLVDQRCRVFRRALCRRTETLAVRYQQAWIDGASTYRITGNRGTAPFLNVTVQGARPDGPGVLHEPFGDIPEANLSGDQLETTADGDFEMFVGGPPKRDRNWLPTTGGSRKLFIRQGFDRWDETPARLSIERVDMGTPRPVPSPETMISAMHWAGTFVTGLMDDWPEFPFTHGGVDESRPNAFPDRADGRGRRVARAAAAVMHWALRPDEALIVEFPAHDGLWMLTNMGAFFTSMDYLYRPVSYTPSRAAGRRRRHGAHRHGPRRSGRSTTGWTPRGSSAET